MTVDGYAAPTTVEEARALILGLGERLARGEISVIAHDALINGLKVYLGDKAAEQEKILARLETSLRAAHVSETMSAHELREQGPPPRTRARTAGADDIVVTVAADFLHGGEPTFARTFDRRGSMVGTVQRAQGEGWAAFKARAMVEAGKVAGACSLLIGGLPDGDGDVGGDSGEGNVSPLPTDDLPRGAITLPEAALHSSQVEALELVRAASACRFGSRQAMGQVDHLDHASG